MTAIDYIREKGFDHQVTAGQVILKRCLFCGDEGSHFYIDPGAEGLFFCHKCQKRGNLFTLKRHFGDIPPKPCSGNGHRKQQTGISQAFSKQDKGNPIGRTLKPPHKLMRGF